MTRRSWTLGVAGLLALALLVLAVVLPVPYVRLRPGPVTNTLGSFDGAPLIVIEGTETYPTTGELLLTTVSVGGRVSLPEAVVGWVDGRTAVVPREAYFPPGQSVEEVNERNQEAMVDSQRAATVAALRAVGLEVPVQVRVSEVVDGTPAEGVLRTGDVLLSVDGEPVTSGVQLRDLIRTREPGETVSLVVRRDGAEQTVVVGTREATEAPGVPVVGVQTSEEEGDLPFTVDIRLEDVGGPSAGLMFALGIVDRLTEEELTGGDVVAGTGVISVDGAVGSIGGIPQKLYAAADAGAEVFLVPGGNCAEAVSSDPPEGLQLLRVETLEDAVTALEVVRDPAAPEPVTC